MGPASLLGRPASAPDTGAPPPPSSSFGGPHDEGVTLTFHDLEFTVTQPFYMRKSEWRDKAKAQRRILRGVSGICRPGEMTAIMGPTASGKSTLLDALAGRKDGRMGPQSIVLVNGQRPGRDFHRLAGYCEQHDHLLGTLTVRESLLFSAELRLSSRTVDRATKKRRVEEVIRELNLEACADSFIGTELVRGISGGEKKRTSLGRELVTDPKLIFLDEPTTGLDARTAGSVAAILADLAERRGKTIVLSIHQPKYSIFKRFHRLILLNHGAIAYQGPARDAEAYFQRLGYVREEANNPADWFLELLCEQDDDRDADTTHAPNNHHNHNHNGGTSVGSSSPAPSAAASSASSVDADGLMMVEVDLESGEGTSTTTAAAAVVASEEAGVGGKGKGTKDEAGGKSFVGMDVMEDGPGPGKGKAKGGGGEEGKAHEQPTATTLSIAQAYRRSPEFQALLAEITPHAAMAAEGGKDGSGEAAAATKSQSPFATSMLEQIGILSRRTLVSVVRDPASVYMQFGAMIFFTVLIGGIYWKIDNGPTGLQNRVGAFFLLVMMCMFSNLSALELFIKERAIFVHEKANGFYRPSAYFIARALCDIIPLRLLPGLLFCAGIYPMMGLRTDVGPPAFWTFTATVILTMLTSAALCLMFSCWVPVFAVANLAVALVFILFMISAGILVNYNQLPAWLLPFKHVSIFRYAMEALTVNELHGMKFNCQAPAAGGGAAGGGSPTGTCVPNGDIYLQVMGYPQPGEVWKNILIIFAMFVFFMVAAFLSLRRSRVA